MKTQKRFSLTALITAAAFAAGFVTVATARTANAAENMGQVAAYVWANDKASASYTPNASYSFNQKKAANTVKKSGPGAYTVSLGGITTSGGNAQVTAYGPGAEHCRVVSWTPAGGGMDVKVACFNGTAPADAQFSLVFFN